VDFNNLVDKGKLVLLQIKTLSACSHLAIYQGAFSPVALNLVSSLDTTVLTGFFVNKAYKLENRNLSDLGLYSKNRKLEANKNCNGYILSKFLSSESCDYFFLLLVFHFHIVLIRPLVI